VAQILIVIPQRDFDPSEVAVTWQQLTIAGHALTFATPDGEAGRGDELMLDGRGLDVWGWIPGLQRVVLVGRLLRANRQARAAYAALENEPAFRKPLAYAQLRVADYAALVLPGGHRARGMRAYLESAELRAFVADFFDSGKPVGAICHGVLLAANAVSKRTGRSVLHGRKTTALTWHLERSAWSLGRIVRFWDPNYYRTYLETSAEPVGARSVESDVKRVLESPDDFRDVARSDPNYARKHSGLVRDSADDDRAAFVVRDGHYVSARWPGDVNTFAKTLLQVIAEVPTVGTTTNV
jgi:putative intracellular protease/amidase